MGYGLALTLQPSTHLGAAFTTGGGSFQHCRGITYQHVLKTGTAISDMTEGMGKTFQIKNDISHTMKLI